MTTSKDHDLDRTESGAVARAGRFFLRALWEVARTLVPAVLIALVINVFVVQATTIDGPSMQPNLYGGHLVMTEKITYRFLHPPRRGDVVVIDMPGEEIPLIKRVIGLPGETVEVQGGRVWIDGKLLEEPWVTRLGGRGCPATNVPPLHVFVLGDNRPNSRDSRSFGPVTLDHLAGHALFIYWPPERIGLLSGK
jgi:signal peptidase I